MPRVEPRSDTMETHEILERFMTIFASHNDAYFDGLLAPVPVVVGLPEDAAERDELRGLARLEWGALLTIYISDWFFDCAETDEAIAWQLIEDTILHEMVHAAVFEKCGVDSFADAHGEAFTDVCNRISRREGWQAVCTPEESIDEAEDSACWPGNAKEEALEF